MMRTSVPGRMAEGRGGAAGIRQPATGRSADAPLVRRLPRADPSIVPAEEFDDARNWTGETGEAGEYFPEDEAAGVAGFEAAAGIAGFEAAAGINSPALGDSTPDPIRAIDPHQTMLVPLAEQIAAELGLVQPGSPPGLACREILDDLLRRAEGHVHAIEDAVRCVLPDQERDRAALTQSLLAVCWALRRLERAVQDLARRGALVPDGIRREADAA